MGMGKFSNCVCTSAVQEKWPSVCCSMYYWQTGRRKQVLIICNSFWRTGEKMVGVGLEFEIITDVN